VDYPTAQWATAPYQHRQLPHPLGVAPELFECVALAHFGVEDVHDHITQIQYHPPAGRRADVVLGTDALLPQPTLRLLGNGFELGFRMARTDDEVIGNCRDFADIQNDDVLGLLVFGAFAAEPR
jgi:hypothetical protein